MSKVNRKIKRVYALNRLLLNNDSFKNMIEVHFNAVLRYQSQEQLEDLVYYCSKAVNPRKYYFSKFIQNLNVFNSKNTHGLGVRPVYESNSYWAEILKYTIHTINMKLNCDGQIPSVLFTSFVDTRILYEIGTRVWSNSERCLLSSFDKSNETK